MTLIASARRLHRMRQFMALMVLAFALTMVVHAGHRHDPNYANTHVACDYCASFGGLIDSEVRADVAPVQHVAYPPPPLTETAPRSARIESAAQPRGPPSC